jgi:acetyl esterase/lipase
MTSDLLRQIVAAMPADFAHPDDDALVTRDKMAPWHGHPLAPDTALVPGAVEGVRTGRLSRPSDDPDRGMVLFCHGGAFVSCDLEAYLFYAEIVADRIGLDVVTVDYRLAPEHRGPAALDDCTAVYRGLVEAGQDPDRVICLGDSCGGGLALAVATRAVRSGLPPPAGVVSLSGWVDLDTAGYGPGGPSIRDPFITEGFLRARARDYVGPEGDPRAAWASPARGPLEGLPPLLLQAGEVDLCRRDAERLAIRARAAGVEVTLDVVEGGIHGVQGLVNVGVPEAVTAWQAVRRFTDRLLPR